MSTAGPTPSDRIDGANGSPLALGLALGAAMVALVVAGPLLLSPAAKDGVGDTPQHVLACWMDALPSGDLETLQLHSAGTVQQQLRDRLADRSAQAIADEFRREFEGLSSRELSPAVSIDSDRVRFSVQLNFGDAWRAGEAELIRREGLWYVAEWTLAPSESTVSETPESSPSDRLEER